MWCVTLHFREFRSVTEIVPKSPFLRVNRSPIRHGFREHLSDMWLSTSEIFAPLQKPRQNHRSYVWTEALSGMVFVHAQKLSGKVWTPIWCVTLHFRDFPSVKEIAPKSPFLRVNRSPFRHGFRVGKKGIRYSMNIALISFSLISGLWKRKYFLHLLIRASCFVQVVNFL